MKELDDWWTKIISPQSDATWMASVGQCDILVTATHIKTSCSVVRSLNHDYIFQINYPYELTFGFNSWIQCHGVKAVVLNNAKYALNVVAYMYTTIIRACMFVLREISPIGYRLLLQDPWMCKRNRLLLGLMKVTVQTAMQL